MEDKNLSFPLVLAGGRGGYASIPKITSPEDIASLREQFEVYLQIAARAEGVTESGQPTTMTTPGGSTVMRDASGQIVAVGKS